MPVEWVYKQLIIQSKIFQSGSKSMAYYKQLTEVDNTGGDVWIHKIEGSTKGTWYARIKRENAAGYFKKSLKTTDMYKAKTKALQYWVQLREAEEQNVVLAPRNNFRALMKAWFKWQERTGRGEVALKSCFYQFKNYYEPYFGAYNVANVTERAYIKYLNEHRLQPSKCPNMRKKPTIRTLDAEQSNLRSFLRWCFIEGKMRARPDMRRVLKNEWWITEKHLVDWDKPQRRDMISMETYEGFRRFLRVVENRRGDDTYESDYQKMSRRRMHFYLLTIYNFVCRAGEEALMLKFEDFAVHQSEIQEDSFYMTINVKYGKVIKRNRGGNKSITYFSDYNYLGYFLQWVEFLKELGFPTGPQDWVFPVAKVRGKSKYHRWRESNDLFDGDYKPFTSQGATRFLKAARPKVKEWMKKNKTLTPRIAEEIDVFSAYSVRHMAIKNLITESGYDFHRVAERANTGVRMIESFYYSYGTKPEGRLVSKHPTPEAKNMQRYKGSEIASVSTIVSLKASKASKKKGQKK